MIETLGATSDSEELGRLAAVDGDAENQRDRLRAEVEALRANTLDALLTNARQSQRDLTRLTSVLRVLASYDTAAYDAARHSLAAAQQRRAQARELLFTPAELHGEPDEEWQRFIVAGDSYRQHLAAQHYPQAGDNCLYCTQSLSPVALDPVGRYRAFLDETVTQQLATAQAAPADASPALDRSELAAALEFASRQAALDEAPSWSAQAAAVLHAADTALNESSTGQALTGAGVTVDAAALVSSLEPLVSDAELATAKLAEDKANAATLLAAKQSELAELTARIELARNLSAAREYVRRAKRADQLEKLSKVISSGAGKQLTIQSKLASEDLVNKNFEGLFTEECSRLRAPGVALTFRGSKRPGATQEGRRQIQAVLGAVRG
ncbi:hypothetical protein [Nocardioides sp. B-3]|uniref:hypothetical protein n=1 Tax=Nocardioides sp. B-3 TaxID=2895565 RepID=UPI0021539715|nr:hypothetical protein [Nocardioides sp. B-3]UUZ58571.1 hypothetical protein LP418_20795 [Nocardioides sp. B-3]